MHQSALEYHRKHGPQALLVRSGGSVEAEYYDGGFAAESPHALYSGTKSFWGPAAVLAEHDGLLRLDESVGEAIDSWARDPVKARVTLAQLLSLTAGIGFGGLGAAVPPYARALDVPIRDVPGSRFTYGGIPLQVFGAVLAKKLEPRSETPHAYLRRRLLEPAHALPSSWRTLSDGTHPLPTGAFYTARAWAAYGAYIAAHAATFARCFTGTTANPRYGLTWWLAFEGLPRDLVYASGSGGQGLYVVPSQQLVIVRFGNGRSYKHEAFLRRALA